MNARRVAAAFSSLVLVVVAGCSGGDKKSSNARPEPLILEPHESSSHLPGDVDFEGRASDDEDGPLGAAALSWQVLDADGDVVGAFQGASGTISLLVPGDYTAVLIAVDSKGKEGTSEHPFRIANTAAMILEPDNADVLDIGAPFEMEARAETIATGVFLQTVTFIGINEATDDEVFRLPVNAPASTQAFTTSVTPSLPAGRFRLRVEVTTTSPAELAEDNIRVAADAAPVVSITSPANGSRVAPGTSIQFSGTVTDAGGGELAIEWISSLEGALSDELEFTSTTLDRAKHRITLRATDEIGLTGSASIDVYIEDAGTPLFVDATGLPNPDVRALAVKPGTPDAIWAGTNNGLARVAANTGVTGASHTTAYNTNGTGVALSAACLASGECLFGFDGLGVSIRDAGDTSWSTFDTGLTDSVVNGIAQSPVDGKLFFATDSGITQTDANRANPVAHDQGVLGNRVTSVAVDASGVVWAGTEDAGLVRLVLPSSVQAFNQDDGLADDFVHAVAVDADGKVWIGTDSGLSRFDPVQNEFTTWDGGDLPVSEKVQALATDGDILWVGTDQGAARYDTSADLWTIFSAVDLASRDVNAIAVDTDGGIWFGCGPAQTDVGGLTRYDGP